MALPQLHRILNLPAAPEPAPPSELTPDKLDHVIRPDAPPGDRTRISSVSQTSENGVYHLRGSAVIELSDSILKADEIDFDEESGEAEAHGHVFYQNFAQGEKITCDHAEYNVNTERGKFYDPHGYTKTRIDSRPGMLTTDNPLYFEAKWAERIEDKYILHSALITDCKLPHPWWTLKAPTIDIIPGDRAIGYKSVFRVRQFPIFFAPFFYKSLKKEPRHSGFLTPNVGHSSLRGYLFGVGYYWAINRSYDAIYRFQDFSMGAQTHHLELRGKPNAHTDFDAIIYGAYDTVKPPGSASSYSGVDALINARSDLGSGWQARANINYLSSLGFRQQFSDSFNGAVYSESNSVGFLAKHQSAYAFNVAAQRIQLFQDVTPGNYVLLDKLPEVTFSGRDQEISHAIVPVWFAFDTSMALLHRSDPTEYLPYPQNTVAQENHYSTEQFMPRLDAAPRVMTAFRWGGFTMMPSLSFHETFFGESFIPGATTGPMLPANALVHSGINRLAPEFGVDFTMPAIERIYNKKTFLGDKLKHVIEPRATYRFVSGIDDFNRLIRFDQTELLTNTNQITVGVTNRLYAKRGDSVSEILTWDLSQQRYFDAGFGNSLIPGQRNVVLDSLELTAYAFLEQPRNYSPVASNLRLTPINGVSIIWQTDYDPLRGGLIDSGLTADFRYRHYFVSAGNNEVRGVNLVSQTGQTQSVNQNFVSPPANQFRALVGFGDTNRRGWSGAASMVYDYRSSILNFATFQATYNTDCCGVNVQVRRLNFGTRDDTQYRVAFSIANIGQFGNLRKQERLF